MAKRLLQFPFTPPAAPLYEYQVANKKYVDDTAGSGTMFTFVEIGPGAADADGNWRFKISGTMLLVQYNNGGGAGNWVTKATFTS